MGMTYYYLAVSLPMLDPDSEKFIPYENFISDCRRLMSPEDFRIVEKATLDCDTQDILAGPVFNRWVSFTREFKSEQARARALRAQKDPALYMRTGRSGDLELLAIVDKAMKESNPWNAEKMLDHFRWQRLEEFSQGHFFDLGYLIVYGLKLQILERQQRFHPSRGKEVFEEFQKTDFLKRN